MPFNFKHDESEAFIFDLRPIKTKDGGIFYRNLVFPFHFSPKWRSRWWSQNEFDRLEPKTCTSFFICANWRYGKWGLCHSSSLWDGRISLASISWRESWITFLVSDLGMKWKKSIKLQLEKKRRKRWNRKSWL